jgi:hypothetical protein
MQLLIPLEIYVADTSNNEIQIVDAKSGNVSTLVGKRVSGFSGDGGSNADWRVLMVWFWIPLGSYI